MAREFPVYVDDEQIQRDRVFYESNVNLPAGSLPNLLTGLNFRPQAGLFALHEGAVIPGKEAPRLTPINDPRVILEAIAKTWPAEHRRIASRGQLPAAIHYSLAHGHYHGNIHNSRICQTDRQHIGEIAFGSETGRHPLIHKWLGRVGLNGADNGSRLATAWFESEDMSEAERKERARVVMGLMFDIAKAAGLSTLRLADALAPPDKQLTVVEQAVDLADFGYFETDETVVRIGRTEVPAVVYERQIGV